MNMWILLYLICIQSVFGIYLLENKINSNLISDNNECTSCCLPLNYSKSENPPPKDQLLRINSKFVIDDVSDVDDESCAVTLVLIMRLSWRDSRLILANYNKNVSLEVDYEWAEKLWLPDLFVSNLRTLTHTGYLDHPGIHVHRWGKGNESHPCKLCYTPP